MNEKLPYDLNKLYEDRARELEELGVLNDIDRIIGKNVAETVKRIRMNIEKMPLSGEDKERLINHIEIITNTKNMEIRHCQKKYYKKGFSDALSLLLDCLRQGKQA